MIAMAQVLSDDEVKAAAEYFAKLKPTAGYNTVKETDTVPKSYVGAGGMRFATRRRRDRADRRAHHRAAQGRDRGKTARSAFRLHRQRAEGRITRGHTLATTGDNGKTVPCGVCHGPDLRGMGEVPPITGRPATYMFASSTTSRTARASARRWL